jgi:hypothetical protein
VAHPALRTRANGAPALDFDTFEGKFRGFSCAPEAIDDRFYDLISIESAKDLAQRFLDTHAETLARHSDGLVELIEQ